MRTSAAILALGAILLTGLSNSSLFAQDQQQPATTTSQAAPSATQARHPVNPQRQARNMARKLGLTPDQESKLEPILADRQQQVESARANTTLAQKDRRAELRTIKQDSDAKVESILNNTQKQQYEQIKQTRKASRRRGVASNNS